MIQQISPDKRLLDAFYADRYGISSPPHGMEFADMTREEALDTFRWCMAKLPSMTEWLREQINADLKLPKAVLNYSPQSLLVLWTWMLSSARIEMLPPETVEHFRQISDRYGEVPDPITVFDITHETRIIKLFVSMYLGRCFTAVSDRLSWNCCLDEDSLSYGQPVLDGFIPSKDDDETADIFAPYSITGLQLSRLMYGSCRDTDLFSVFEAWKKRLPERKI